MPAEPIVDDTGHTIFSKMTTPTSPQRTPQARLIAGAARVDVTPPVGMYHRMWGAAIHDRSTGVHRPLTATALWLQPRRESGSAGDAMLILAIDHCILERAEMDRIRIAAGKATSIPAEQVHVCLSHTHAAGFMSRSRADLPGGDLIGPYLDELAVRAAECAAGAQRLAKPATLVATYGRCDLARHRDFYDVESKQFVCGFNPHGGGDDTLVVGRLTTDATDGRPRSVIATLVNYACHPTTLAWQNTLVSPDYVGLLRETIENETGGAPCVFLQGASGDLGPREGFVGDVSVADRNGRQLGLAALSTLTTLPEAGTQFQYTGPVVSGATLGTWCHEPLNEQALNVAASWKHRAFTLPLGYKPELPTIAATRAELAKWNEEIRKAGEAQDEARLSECRARAERMTRQLAKLSLLPPGTMFPYTATLARTGGILWVFAPGELYQVLQVELRRRFPEFAVVVATICDDWQPGYLPISATYGRGIYQEQIAVVAAGSLEALIERTALELQTLTQA